MFWFFHTWFNQALLAQVDFDNASLASYFIFIDNIYTMVRNPPKDSLKQE